GCESMQSLFGPLQKNLCHDWMRSKVISCNHIEFRIPSCNRFRRSVDPFYQSAVEQHERENKQTFEAKSGSTLYAVEYKRLGGTGETCEGTAELHAFFQQARKFVYIRVGIGIIGAPANYHQTCVAP